MSEGADTTAAPNEQPAPRGSSMTAFRAFLARHGRKLWWLHTTYALSFGVFIVIFAQRGFEYARWLAFSLGVAWLIFLVFFRLFGSGAQQDFITAWPGARLRFVVMTYALKAIHQSMLFFLLPFYWKASTLDSLNSGFVFLLGACAVLSTLDLVFDRVLVRSKLLATVFYVITLFSCLNLVIPSLLPNTRTLITLLITAGISVVAFFTLHVPPSALKHKQTLAILAGCVLAGVLAAYFGRAVIPPVPMSVSKAAVGPEVLPDGRLAMEVTAIHPSRLVGLSAVTFVVAPGGVGDRLSHVWRRDGDAVARFDSPVSTESAPGVIRLRSTLDILPPSPSGYWSVDVETEDGRLIGRASFRVLE